MVVLHKLLLFYGCLNVPRVLQLIVPVQGSSILVKSSGSLIVLITANALIGTSGNTALNRLAQPIKVAPRVITSSIRTIFCGFGNIDLTWMVSKCFCAVGLSAALAYAAFLTASILSKQG